MIYTDNYQLRKPVVGVDNADVNDLNFNFDRIDAIMHFTQISLADAYDSTKAYAEGDVVMYELLMYKCIAPTIGVWDASKWERTTASECGASTKLIGVASGNPASFPDGSDNLLEACNVDINPMQDLHGYDKPWAGGTQKNKLDKSNFSDVTTAFKSLVLTLKPNTTYTMSSTIPKNTGNTANSFFYLAGVTPTTNNNGIWNGQTRTITTGADGEVRVGYRAEGFSDTSPEYYMSFDFQVEEGSTATTYEPYSNICPITPRTEVNITVSATQGGSGENTQIALGRDVYGGTLNVKTGELTVDRAIITISSEAQFLTFSANSTYGSLATIATNGKVNNSEVMAISNIAIGISNDDRVSADYVSLDRTYIDDVGGVRVRASKEVSINTKAEMLTRFNGAQVCYKLATPLIYTLTPQEVRSILGQNYIEADSGEIMVVYVRDPNSCISNIISRLEALEQANSNRSLSLNRSLSKGVEEPQEEPSEELKEEPNEEVNKELEVKEEENNDANER